MHRPYPLKLSTFCIVDVADIWHTHNTLVYTRDGVLKAMALASSRLDDNWSCPWLWGPSPWPWPRTSCPWPWPWPRKTYLKYFSVLWLKLTVNFITNFENLAIKMKLVITSPAINVCVLKFWLNSEPYWHWPWQLTPSCVGHGDQVLGLEVFGLDSKSGIHLAYDSMTLISWTLYGHTVPCTGAVLYNQLRLMNSCVSCSYSHNI